MHSNEASAERNFTDGQEYFKKSFCLTGVETHKLFLQFRNGETAWVSSNIQIQQN